MLSQKEIIFRYILIFYNVNNFHNTVSNLYRVIIEFPKLTFWVVSHLIFKKNEFWIFDKKKFFFLLQLFLSLAFTTFLYFRESWTDHHILPNKICCILCLERIQWKSSQTYTQRLRKNLNSKFSINEST
jgi:hypothetical protein